MGYSEEIGQLKSAAQALRDELDSQQYTSAENLQASERDRRDEVHHLQNTIATMRRELDEAKKAAPKRKSKNAEGSAARSRKKEL